MSSNIHRFATSRHETTSGHTPLGRIVREAEIERSRETARLVSAGWARLMRLFRAKPAGENSAAQAAVTDSRDKPRLAA